MIKIITVLSCVFVLSSASFITTLIKTLAGFDSIPARVRTVEERDARSNESVVLDFIGLVQRFEGYKAEEYNVTTEDGYILGLHRIIAAPNSPPAEGKPVVYIQHGFAGSSDFFVILGPEKDLAFQLANAGYDVWLGNIRGNTYSRSHINNKPDNWEFWDFRMDHIGEYDMSTFIDYILNKTGQEKLTFIGYSMGPTLIFMLLSTKPEYNEKINLLVSLAPATYFSSPGNETLDSIMSSILTFTSPFKYELLPQSVAIADYAKETCNDPVTNLCKSFFAVSADLDNLATSEIPEILAHAPAGTGYYVLEQYHQIVLNRTLRKYDYPCRFFDTVCPNEVFYNQSTPPFYDLSLITVPSIIFYSTADVFVNVTDAVRLNNTLQNVIALEEVPDYKFNHLDFIWSLKAKSLVYDRLLVLMSNFLSK